MEPCPIVIIAFPLLDSALADLRRQWESLTHLPTSLATKPWDNRSLTLSYLDQVRSEDIPAILVSLSLRIHEMPKPEFHFQRLEPFYSSPRSYVVASAEAAEAREWSICLRQLRTKLRHELAPLIDDRPWSPHVTIAAIEGSPSMRDLNLPLTPITWRPRTLAVYRKNSRGENGHIIRTFELS